ncbi:alanine dehydrogenase, partial [Paenibacillus sp. TAF58]
MIIGVPKEIKNNEFRVGMTPSSVMSYKKAGHGIIVETLAGQSIGFTDEDYTEAGATIVASAAEVWSADMVVKVKEPLPEEYGYFHEGL